MLGPGLAQRLKFNVGGPSMYASEVILDPLHLLQAEGDTQLLAYLHQLVVRGSQEVNSEEGKRDLFPPVDLAQGYASIQ